MMHQENASSEHASGPLIGFGRVYHSRLRPREHRFVYPTFMLMLPMRSLHKNPQQAGVLSLNQSGLMSFWDVDHGDGREPSQGGALAWLDDVLRSEGIDDATGEVWLQCFPRIWGYTFKPVSFWYCHRPDGTLRAIVAEVNNTFGERHTYVLDHPTVGQEIRADKVFHVSPFCQVSGHYSFDFQRSSTCEPARAHDKLRVRVDYADPQGPLLLTGISIRLQALTRQARRQALWTYPFMTLSVMARIHWHALLLWFKRVPFYRKPQPPRQSVSRRSLFR